MLTARTGPSSELCSVCEEPMRRVRYRYLAPGGESRTSEIDLCTQCDLEPGDLTVKDLFYGLGDAQ